MQYKYEYPRASVTVDIAVFCLFSDGQKVLLIQRGNPPFENIWALPGGFIEMDEKMVDSAYRELEEETSVSGVKLFQFGAYGAPERDPRGHTVSIVFKGIVNQQDTKIVAMDDAKAVDWFSVSSLPEMAFDHGAIVEDVLRQDCEIKEQE